MSETGEIYTKSPLTGSYYRVTRWEYLGGGKLRALEKDEVDREDVPEESLEGLDE